MPSELLYNFTADKLSGKYINILSLRRYKLMLSQSGLSQLFIYSRKGRYLSIITANDNITSYLTLHGHLVVALCIRRVGFL